MMTGRMAFDSGRLREARDALERTMALAQAAGHRHRRSEATMVMTWTIDESATPVPEALAELEKLKREAVDDRLGEGALNLSIATNLALTGRIDEAKRLAESTRRVFEDLGARFQLTTFVSLRIAQIERLAGDLEAAVARIREAYVELERMGNTGFLSSRAGFLAMVLPDLGRDVEALEFAEITERIAAQDDLEPQLWGREGRAKVLSKRGEHEEAERLAAEAVYIASASEWAVRHADALVTLGEVRAAAGNRSGAAQALAEALEMYERKGATLPAKRVRARLESLEGRAHKR
jgi:tetratricopeptide (TPR) repeat protein